MVLKGINPIFFSTKTRGPKNFTEISPNSEENLAIKNCSQQQSNGTENSTVLGKEVPVRDADPAITCHDLI